MITIFRFALNEVIACYLESLVIVEGDSFIFDGVSAGFSARLKFVAIAGGVAIIRVLIFRAVSEGDVLFIVGINGESAAGESVFKDIFGRVGGDFDFGEWSRSWHCRVANYCGFRFFVEYTEDEEGAKCDSC